MSYPMVLNEQMKDLTTYKPQEHTVGQFNKKSCSANFNMLEKDLKTSRKGTISISAPLAEYRTEDG